MDVKGFEHLGVAWSWPEFEEPSGKMIRVAHAWASEGMTACGEVWPHRIEPRIGSAGKAYLSPKYSRVEEIRDAEDRSAYLCARCMSVTLQGS